MKKYIIHFSLALLLLGAVACKKTTTGDRTTNVVKPHYPTITLTGLQFVSTAIGTGSYTDPGAKGKDDITKEVTTLAPVKNTVDLTTPGFYTVEYRLRNGDGYETTTTRFVLVTGVDAAKDFAGLYQRNGDPNRNSNLSKIGTGLYKIDNIGGVNLITQGPPLSAYIGFVDDSTIAIPSQASETDGSNVEGTEGKFMIDNSGVPADTILQWRMVAGPFNTTVTRIFYKAH